MIHARQFRAICVFAVTVVIVGAAFAFSAPSNAQESETPTAQPTITPTAYPFQDLFFALQGSARIEVAKPGSSIIRTGLTTIAPGTETELFANDGPTILYLQSGNLIVTSTLGAISVLDAGEVLGMAPLSATPGPLDEALIQTGEQLFLPNGAATTLRNEGDIPVNLLILTVAPLRAPASPTPSP